MGDNINRWRTIFITDANKLLLRLNHLVVKSNTYEVEINLDEIKNILVQDDKTIISFALLSQLANKGIELIVVNNSNMPSGVLLPIENNTRTTKRKIEQIEFIKTYGPKVWQKIIKAKIYNMKINLERISFRSTIMNQYLLNVAENDITNREGLATKFYFYHYFGKDFKRHEDDILNSCMNYTYQIIRSRISQQLIAKGYDPCFGFYHKSEYNPFCLSDDLIEVYRPIVDYYIINLLEEYSDYETLTNSLKVMLIDILNYKVIFDNKLMALDTTISSYIDQVFNKNERFVFPQLGKTDAK